jgi:transcriptional regulator with XRE-family HTH domain
LAACIERAKEKLILAAHKRGRGTAGNDIQQSLPVALRRLRAAKGLTQKKVSEALGIQQQSYNQYESGRATPPPDKLAKLAELYGVTTDYLLGREDAGTARDSGPGYAANLDAMACKLAYHEIMRAVESRPRKLAEFRRTLEQFRGNT